MYSLKKSTNWISFWIVQADKHHKVAPSKGPDLERSTLLLISYK